MLSSSEDKAIDLLQLLSTLSKTYPPLSCFIYCPLFYIQNIKQSSSYRTAYIGPDCADCGKYSLWITFYRLCNNRILLKYITILCATPCHV